MTTLGAWTRLGYLLIVTMCILLGAQRTALGFRSGCPSLSSPANGRVSVNTYNIGGRATYTCNSGYGVFGSSSRTCSSSGTWSGSQPSCQTACSSPSQPSYGYVSVSSLLVGGRASYSCYYGLQLNGSSSRTCLSSRVWSGTPPTCGCPSLSSPSNGRVSVNTYNVGGRATYTCNYGYRVSGSSSRTCSLDHHPYYHSYYSGSWTGSQPSCQRVCPSLSNPANGRISVNTYNIGGRATYSCNSGYGVSGSSSRTCSSSGSWTGSQPSCQPVCSTPSRPSYGYVSVSSLLVDGRASYSCYHGLRLIGSSTRTCLSFRVWSGTPPTCGCPSLSNPANGRVSVSTYNVSGRATYYCNSGYTLSGALSTICVSSGWFHSEPTSCQRNKIYEVCEEPKHPANAFVSVSSLSVGGLIFYICYPGFTLIGTPTRRCLSSGRWTGTQAFCIDVTVEGRDCSADDYRFVTHQREQQERVIQSIVEDILPSLQTVDSEPSVVYNALSQALNVTPSDRKFKRFIEALTEISAAENEACSGVSIPSVKDILRIVGEFTHALSAGRDRDLSNIRLLYGQMLCVKREVESPSKGRKKRDDHCMCPDGGLQGSAIEHPCQFFRCLDPEYLPSIFGITTANFPGLAFVIDTTGSMGNEIDAARRVILDFVRAEENFGDDNGFYMLVPFNDLGPDQADESVGPIVVGYTDNAQDLTDFYRNVRTLHVSGGGDLEEYSLDGMLKALEFVDDEFEDSVMVSGSQIIVLTDAPSKNKELGETVANIASEKGVCIHFFLSNPPTSNSITTDDVIYKKIADKTHGIRVHNFDGWKLATFAASYRDTPCGYAQDNIGKRALSTSSPCHSFQISILASLFKFSGQASSTVTLTRPSGSMIVIAPLSNLAIHSEPHPEAGEWLACVSSGNLNISINQDISLDATILYMKQRSSGMIIPSVSPPTECSIGRIMLASSNNSQLLRADIRLLDSERNVRQTSPLSKCSTGLFANVTFPSGAYTYQLDGIDSSGSPVTYHIKKVVKFKKGNYSLDLDSSDTMDVEPQDTICFSFNVRNLNEYPSRFDFSVLASRQSISYQPTQQVISPGESVRVNVTAQVSSSSIVQDTHTSYIFEIEAANGCDTLRSTKTVRVQAQSNVCGCLNGGLCIIITRRGRNYHRCQCSSGYRGSKCQFDPIS